MLPIQVGFGATSSVRPAMNDLSSLDRVIGEVLEDAETGVSLALQPIVQALDASYALLFRAGMRTDRVEDASCFGIDSAYLDRLQTAARERIMPLWLATLPGGSVFDRAAFGDDRQFARTAFYDHVVRPEGRFHCLIATPLASPRSRFHLVVGRPRTRQGFCEDEQRLLRLTLPYLGGVLRMQSDLQATHALAQHAIGLLAERDDPLMVVRCDGVLLSANAAARLWLTVDRVLRIDEATRLLRPTNATDADRLRAALAAAATSDRAQALTLSSPVAVPAEMTIKRITGSADQTPGSTACATRLLVTVGRRAAPPVEDRALELSREHGLTQRETALLREMLGGATLKGASAQLGFSYNTGRSHLRQIFGKLDLHRQSDLVRLATVGR